MLPISGVVKQANGKGNQNNLYCSGLPKELEGDASETAFRRVFARFRKIASFKLINSSKFETNLVFVAYRHPS